MKNLLLITFALFGLSSINAQIASSDAQNNLEASKKVEEVVVTTKKVESKKIYFSLVRTVKVIPEDKKKTQALVAKG